MRMFFSLIHSIFILFGLSHFTMALSTPTSPRVILVCGATGKTGSAAVHALLSHNKKDDDDDDNNSDAVQVLALVRDTTLPAAVALQQKGAVLVQGDFGNPDSLKAAFAQGVDACFLACANQPNQVELETNVIDAAESSNSCRYLVKIGTCGAPGVPTEGIPDFTSMDSLVEYGRFHAAIEERLAKCNPSKLAWTCLRPNHFMQNHVGDLLATLPKVIYPHTMAQANIVDVRDVGEVAAKLLLLSHDARRRHEGQYYHVCGPQGWSSEELAALYSRMLNIPAEAVACDAAAFQTGLVQGAGFPHWLAQAVTASHVNFWARGAVQYASSDAVMELHPTFRTMEAWVQEMAPMVPTQTNQ